MNRSIKLRAVSGTVAVPASKSMMQRVCAAALLHKGSTRVYHYGHSEDDEAALRIIQQLGAVISKGQDHLTIQSSGTVTATGMIDCGESGLSARLFIPVAALGETVVQISGRGSLLRRPMTIFGDVLPELGVSLSDFNGFIPFCLQGPLQAADIQIDGSLSSQFISGLLFALSHAATKPLTIAVNGLSSKPYIDLTMDVMALFGKPISHENYTSFCIDPAEFAPQEHITVNIEGDWSSAAFWIAAAAMNGRIKLTGLKQNSRQADRSLLHIVQQCGAEVQWSGSALVIQHRNLTSFNYDATDSPDLFPVLAVLAGACRGESSIKGLGRLVHKESNRSEAIQLMLQRLGVSCRVADDTLFISGTETFRSCTIDSFHDHRMVMAAALASLQSEGEINILHTESVQKSYPAFFDDLQLLIR